ncbi:MAG TPA: DUF1801 domain-containing protein [Chitinophagales bacterium]
MAKNKTAETEVSVLDFIKAFADSDQKQKESFELLKLLEKATGFPAKMWGPSIIGFGSYHYKYESGHEGEAPLAGFSPRKSAISLYVFTGLKEHEYLLENLGKFKMGKACIYASKLADINQDVLVKLVRETVSYLQKKYPKK